MERDGLNRTPEIDFENFVETATRERREAITHALAALGRNVRLTRRPVGIAAAAALFATAMFWAVMLTAPPISEANTPASAKIKADRIRELEEMVPPIGTPNIFVPCPTLTNCSK